MGNQSPRLRSSGRQVCTSAPIRSTQWPKRPVRCLETTLTENAKELLLVALDDSAKEFCTSEIGIARGLEARGWAKLVRSKTWRLTDAGFEAALSLLKGSKKQ